MKDVPKFTNDCGACVFLGRHRYSTSTTDGKRTMEVDLYQCDSMLVVRYGQGNRYAKWSIGMWRAATSDDKSEHLREGFLEGEKRVAELARKGPTPIPSTSYPSAFRPPHEADCTACVFLGTYEYTADFTNKKRTIKVDLWCCTNKREPTLIVRFGAEGDYSSMPVDVWSTKDKTLGTYGPAIDEAGKRAAALHLIKLPERRSPNWLDGMIVEASVRVRADNVENALQLLADATTEARLMMRQKGGGWARGGNGVEGAVLVEFAPYVALPVAQSMPAPTPVTAPSAKSTSQLPLTLAGERYPYITTKELVVWLNAVTCANGGVSSWDTDRMRDMLVRAGALVHMPEAESYQGTPRRPKPKTVRRQYVTTLDRLKKHAPDIFRTIAIGSTTERIEHVLRECTTLEKLGV